jgi:hypothetical protein
MVDPVVDRFSTFVVLGLHHVIASKNCQGFMVNFTADADDQMQQIYVSQPYQPHQ